MTSDHLILVSFCLLVLAAFIFVGKHGIRSTQRLCVGVMGLIVLSAAAIGLHWYLNSDAGPFEPKAPLVSISDVGLGLLFLVLTSLGLLCSCSEKRANDNDHITAHHHRD